MSKRLTKLDRNAVFELLLSIQMSAGKAPSNVEGKIAFLHEMDAIVDKFIYADDPLAKESEALHA